MLYILLLYAVVQGVGAKSSWECLALDGELVPNGESFVPGPDYCSVCKCDEGKPRVCRAVLCQPPQDCNSFRLGRSCCDFICLDGILPKMPDGNGNMPSTDLGLRMVASAVTAILSLALLLFLIHRLRQRRIRAQQQYYEDQLDSPGGLHPDSCQSNACCHNAAYCNGNDHVDFFLDGHTPPYSMWKPPSFYFPHEDAPPPYSEVVGSSYRLSEASNSLGPFMVQLGPSPGESSDNNRGSIALIGAIGGGYRRPSSPSLSPHNITPEGAKGTGVTLRSDEMYEDADGNPDMDGPPPCYTPSQPLNDLNRGTDLRAVGESVPAICSDAAGCSATAATTQECVCGEDSSCNLCASYKHGASRNNNTVQQLSVSPIRMRPPREKRSSLLQRDGERTSTLEEFQLCLSMDISDSSTSSDVPTRTFSSSSEDSTSMDTTSEMR